MDYKCKFCFEPFAKVPEILAHLRKSHNVVENDVRIKCLVNHSAKNVCEKSYLTFSSLKFHMKSCVALKQKIDAENSTEPDELSESFQILSCDSSMQLSVLNNNCSSNNMIDTDNVNMNSKWK